MDSIKEQVRARYAKAGEEERRQIQADIRDLQTSLDDDWDSIVRLASGPFQMSLALIGVDLNIFPLVSASGDPLSLTDLVQKTGAAPILLSHLLRAMASFGLINQSSADTYSASTMTHRLANPHVIGAIPHVSDVHIPVYQALPQWFKEHKYQDIQSQDLPFHAALNTKLPPFQWMQQHPEQLKALGHAMAIQRPINWVDSYPVPEEVKDFSAAPESALLVDVGGGFGQQASAFKAKFPELKGRTVVQDIPGTLAAAPPVDGIEFQAHDFFTEQPIKGAKFYYLRHILHDWSDGDSIRILQSITPAMGPESKIVIDEIVLPDKDVPWQCALMDIVMLSCLGGRERTRSEWEQLLDAAGLKIVDVHKYDAKLQSVIVAVPK